MFSIIMSNNSDMSNDSTVSDNSIISNSSIISNNPTMSNNSDMHNRRTKKESRNPSKKQKPPKLDRISKSMEKAFKSGCVCFFDHTKEAEFAERLRKQKEDDARNGYVDSNGDVD